MGIQLAREPPSLSCDRGTTGGLSPAPAHGREQTDRPSAWDEAVGSRAQLFQKASCARAAAFPAAAHGSSLMAVVPPRRTDPLRGSWPRVPVQMPRGAIRTCVMSDQVTVAAGSKGGSSDSWRAIPARLRSPSPDVHREDLHPLARTTALGTAASPSQARTHQQPVSVGLWPYGCG